MTNWIPDTAFSFEQNQQITRTPCPDCPSREGEVCAGVPEGAHHASRVLAARVAPPSHEAPREVIDVGLEAYLDEAEAKAAQLMSRPARELAAELRHEYLEVLARVMALLARNGPPDILAELDETSSRAAFLILVAHDLANRGLFDAGPSRRPPRRPGHRRK